MFEGAHGAGKTTFAKLTVSELKKRGIAAVYTKEPYARELKPVISLFSNKPRTKTEALAFLISADRSVHVDMINRWLRKGVYVVCDRYIPSSYVYQSIDGLDRKFIDLLNSSFLPPDLIVLISASLETRLKRIRNNKKGTKSRFMNNLALGKEQQLYSDFLLKNKSKIILIENDQFSEKSIYKIMESILSLR